MTAAGDARSVAAVAVENTPSGSASADREGQIIPTRSDLKKTLPNHQMFGGDVKPYQPVIWVRIGAYISVRNSRPLRRTHQSNRIRSPVGAPATRLFTGSKTAPAEHLEA